MATETVVIRFRADGTRVVERGIDRIQKKSAGAATTVGFLKRALGFVGVAAALRGLIGTIAKFEQAISTVGAVSGATASQLADLENKAKELGATTRFSATQAAEGLTFLSRAGFDVSESLEAIGPTLQLAQAGALDLGRAADIASNILQGFRLETSETTRVVDVLAKAANSSNTNVAQLGDAMAKAAPIASGLGISIEETTAAIGALSNAGIQGESAGAGLVRVLSELESPSSKTIKLFKTLGVEASQFKVSQVGLTAAIKTLAEAGVDAGNSLEAFGVRGGPAFEVLSSSIPDIEKLNTELDNAAGTAAKVSAVMDDNLNGALLSVKSAFEAVVLAIGDLQGSGLETFFRGLASGLRFVANNAEELAKAVGAGLLVPALLLAASAVRKLTLAMASNPAGLFAVAISSAVAALVFFRKEIKLSEDGVVSLDNVIGVFVDNIAISFNFVKDLLSDVFGPFADSSEKAVGEAEGSFFGFARTIAKIADIITFPFQNAVAQIALAFRFGFDAIRSGVVQAVNFIIRKIDGFLISIQRNLNEVIRLTNKVTAQASAAVGLAGKGLDIKNVVVGQIGEIENSFAGAGETWARASVDSFKKLSEGPGGFEQILESIVAQSRLKAEEAAAAASNAALLAPERQELPTSGGGAATAADVTGGGDEKENQLLRDKASILAQVTEQRKVAAEQLVIDTQNLTTLNELRASGAITQEEFNMLIDEMGIKMTENTGPMEGFRKAFEKIGTTAEDVGNQIGNALVGAIGKASDALADFAVNGFQDVDSLREAFADLLKDLAKQIIKIIIQTLILKAIQAGLGGAGGGTGQVVGTAVGSAAGGAATSGARAAGGPVSGGDPFLVGERGPEVFTPTRTGNITPMSPESMKPEVNVQVVNVQDPNDVTEAMNSPEGQQTILNTIRQNPEALQ